MTVRATFAAVLAGALQMLLVAQAAAGNAGSVTFLDDKDERVVISRDFDPLTGTLTNVITITRRDGTTETQTVTTTQNEDGGYDVTRSVTGFDGKDSRSTAHFGGRGNNSRGSGRGAAGRPGGRSRP